jgi:4-aminobutyrate aminotransferase/(S)-3-amino-2-methylpropionate transaminase
MEEDGLVERAARLGRETQDRLRRLMQLSGRVGDVRGLGLMIGVELVDPQGKPDASAVQRVRDECLEQGVVVLSCGTDGNVLRLIPALTISEDELDEGLSAIEAAILEL